MVGMLLLIEKLVKFKEPNMRAKDIVNNKDILDRYVKDTDFAKFIEKKYKVTSASIIEDDEVE
jgi:hypothetical protein